MKRLVTLVVVAALLSSVAVAFADPVSEDTLILKATVEPYAAVWFANAGTFGTDDWSDMMVVGTEKSLNFNFGASAMEDMMRWGGEAVAQTQATTLQARTNYGVDLAITAKAPVAANFSAAFLRTEITVDDILFVGGSQNGTQWDEFGNLPATTIDLCPATEQDAEVNFIEELTGAPSFALSGWSDAGLSIPFTVAVYPQTYHRQNPGTAYSAEEYNPALADDYEGYIKATLTATP